MKINKGYKRFYKKYVKKFLPLGGFDVYGFAVGAKDVGKAFTWGYKAGKKLANGDIDLEGFFEEYEKAFMNNDQKDDNVVDFNNYVKEA